MKRKAELQAIIAEARNELNDIEDQERCDRNAKYVGRCYRYRNSYGHGESWWLYAMVTGISEDGLMSGIRFQNDGNGKLDFETDRYMSESTLQEPITRAEFDAAFSAFVTAITSQHSV